MFKTEDKMEEVETLAALAEAAGEIERGEVVPAAEMIARLRKEFGMPRRSRGSSGLDRAHRPDASR